MTILTALALLLVAQNPPLSCTWGAAREIGALEQIVNEASGLAISRRVPNRMYHTNDSGDSGRFFMTDLAGTNTRVVNVAGFMPMDSEDLAMGPCGDGKDCIFIADIGNNSRRRQELEIVVVEEQTEFPSEVPARFRVRVRYPDAAHDAESLAVHPDGSIYIVSKNLASGTTPAGIAQLYRLSAEQWRSNKGAAETLERVATFDIGKLLPGMTGNALLPTAMDIAPDGKRLLLLTYGAAVEFLFDVSGPIPAPETWKAGQQYLRIPVSVLEQQEAIAYLPGGQSFIYETERSTANPRARVMRVDCTPN